MACLFRYGLGYPFFNGGARLPSNAPACFTCYHGYSNTMGNCAGRVNVVFAEPYILWQMQDKFKTRGAGKNPMEEKHRGGRKNANRMATVLIQVQD